MNTERLHALLTELDLEPSTARSVLVVDDDPDVRDSLKMLLSSDFDVAVAEDGPDALSFLATHGPVDLVISDQRMPMMSGVQLLEVVSRRHPATARIVLTAYSDLDPIVDAVNRGSIWRFMLKPYDPQGLRRTVREVLDLKATRDTLDRVVTALTQGRETTRRALADLTHTRAEVDRTERMATLGWLAGGTTVELQSLVVMMHGLLDTVGDALKEAGHDALIPKTARSVNSMLREVRNIHDLSEGRELSHHPVPVDVEAFTSELVLMFQTEALGLGRQVDLSVEVGARLLVIDLAQIAQALLALLRNGAQASPPGAALELRVSMEGRWGAIFEVRDDGHGMQLEQLERATAPFYSAFRPRRLGLGLALADRVAQQHGGELRLVSIAGQGTIARLRVPISPPEALA